MPRFIDTETSLSETARRYLCHFRRLQSWPVVLFLGRSGCLNLPDAIVSTPLIIANIIMPCGKPVQRDVTNMASDQIGWVKICLDCCIMHILSQCNMASRLFGSRRGQKLIAVELLQDSADILKIVTYEC
jgi:hypothetical protein